MRLSSAAQPTADGKQPLTPGMGLKFLRDAIDSANLVSMNNVNGQLNDWNFFSEDFSTHIPVASGIQLTALFDKFSSATSYIQEIGLSNFAKAG